MPEINTDSPTLTSLYSNNSRQLAYLIVCLAKRFQRELSTLHIACIRFRILFPFFGQLLKWKDRRHRADRNAGTAINALDGINVELLNFIEGRTAILIAGVLLRVDAVHRTSIYTGGIFDPDAGSAIT